MNQQKNDVDPTRAKDKAEGDKVADGAKGNWEKQVLDHLKERGHVWVIVLAVLTAFLYIWYATTTQVPPDRFVGNVVLAVVAVIAAVGGAIALLVLAMLKAADCGELKDFRYQLVLGLIVGVAISFHQLLILFGVAT
jgi:hypothetical protein